MSSATFASQRMDSSRAFFINPLRLLENVICRVLLFSIRFISTFFFPILLRAETLASFFFYSDFSLYYLRPSTIISLSLSLCSVTALSSEKENTVLISIGLACWFLIRHVPNDQIAIQVNNLFSFHFLNILFYFIVQQVKRSQSHMPTWCRAVQFCKT